MNEDEHTIRGIYGIISISIRITRKIVEQFKDKIELSYKPSKNRFILDLMYRNLLVRSKYGSITDYAILKVCNHLNTIFNNDDTYENMIGKFKLTWICLTLIFNGEKNCYGDRLIEIKVSPKENIILHQDAEKCYHISTLCLNCALDTNVKGKRYKCGNCAIAYYCDKRCQTMDWIEHKKTCCLGN